MFYLFQIWLQKEKLCNLIWYRELSNQWEFSKYDENQGLLGHEFDVSGL